MINPADGVRRGSAMLREYEYKYPAQLDYQIIPEGTNKQISEILDSIIQTSRGKYDCVWFTHNIDCKVYNLKEETK